MEKNNNQNQEIEGYNNLVSKIIDEMYSRDANRYSELLSSDQFKSILSDTFGFEAANFHFYDMDEGQLMFFHEAVANGVQMPSYFIDIKNEDGTFNSRLIDEKEFEARRNQQKESRKQGEPLTVDLCHENLISDHHRWSEKEKENEWIYIPEGEIIIFCYEYILRKQLQENKILTLNEAMTLINESNTAVHCWEKMHNKNNFPLMQGRESKSFREMISWLEDVLKNKENYGYLWQCNERIKNWFIIGSNELYKLLDQYRNQEMDNGFLKNLAGLIIKCTYKSDKSDGNINLDETNFFNRTRISPRMELMHGTHNIVVFFIVTYFPSGLVPTSEPLKAFLLGSFYDRDIFFKNNKKIKGLFSLIASRDLFNFSMKKLAKSLERIKKAEEIMATLSSSTYIHGIKGPLNLISMNADLIRDKAMEKGLLEEFKDSIDIISNQSIRAFNIIEAARKITRMAEKKNKKPITIQKFIQEYIEKYKADIAMSDSARVTFNLDFQEKDVYILLRDEFSLETVFENLFNNSIEAAPGEVKISINVQENREKVHISIIDNGPGISESVMESIFNPFFTTKKKKNAGLGLGLYISKHLVELEGGNISAKNINNGTCFTINFDKYIKLGGE